MSKNKLFLLYAAFSSVINFAASCSGESDGAGKFTSSEFSEAGDRLAPAGEPDNVNSQGQGTVYDVYKDSIHNKATFVYRCGNESGKNTCGLTSVFVPQKNSDGTVMATGGDGTRYWKGTKIEIYTIQSGLVSVETIAYVAIAPYVNQPNPNVPTVPVRTSTEIDKIPPVVRQHTVSAIQQLSSSRNGAEFYVLSYRPFVGSYDDEEDDNDMSKNLGFICYVNDDHEGYVEKDKTILVLAKIFREATEMQGKTAQITSSEAEDAVKSIKSNSDAERICKEALENCHDTEGKTADEERKEHEGDAGSSGSAVDEVLEKVRHEWVIGDTLGAYSCPFASITAGEFRGKCCKTVNHGSWCENFAVVEMSKDDYDRLPTKSPVIVCDKNCREYYHIIDESELQYITEGFSQKH